MKSQLSIYLGFSHDLLLYMILKIRKLTKITSEQIIFFYAIPLWNGVGRNIALLNPIGLKYRDIWFM